MTIDTTNLCSHLQRKLFDEDGIYHPIWIAMQDDPELTAVVRSRQLHIYRRSATKETLGLSKNGKKILVLAGKSAPRMSSPRLRACCSSACRYTFCRAFVAE